MTYKIIPWKVLVDGSDISETLIYRTKVLPRTEIVGWSLHVQDTLMTSKIIPWKLMVDGPGISETLIGQKYYQGQKLFNDPYMSKTHSYDFKDNTLESTGGWLTIWRLLCD